MFEREGWITADSSEPVVSWVPSFFHFMGWVASNTTWLLIGAVVLWALFEWRVRSENKALARMAALGTAALGLLVVAMLMAAALVMPVAMTLPALESRIPERVVMDKQAHIDASLSALEQALADKDWEAMQKHANQASQAMDGLALMGAAAPALVAKHEQPKVDDLREQLKLARQYLREAQQATWAKDPERLEAAIKKFQVAYKPVRDAATK